MSKAIKNGCPNQSNPKALVDALGPALPSGLYYKTHYDYKNYDESYDRISGVSNYDVSVINYNASVVYYDTKVL